MEPIEASFLDSFETGNQKMDDDELNSLIISSYLGGKANSFICSLMNLVFICLFHTKIQLIHTLENFSWLILNTVHSFPV